MMNTLKLLIPALIPSWRFFDIIAPSPRIEISNLEGKDDPAQNWSEFNPQPAYISVFEMFARMFWNPGRNEALFLVSCAERLIANPTEHSVQEISKRLARQLQVQGNGSPYFQFRLVFVYRDGEEMRREVAFISSVYALSEEGTHHGV